MHDSGYEKPGGHALGELSLDAAIDRRNALPNGRHPVLRRPFVHLFHFPCYLSAWRAFAKR